MQAVEVREILHEVFGAKDKMMFENLVMGNHGLLLFLLQAYRYCDSSYIMDDSDPVCARYSAAQLVLLEYGRNLRRLCALESGSRAFLPVSVS